MKKVITALEKLLKIFEENSKANQKRNKEISTILDNLLEDFKAVWKLGDNDDWIKSVKKEFDKIKKML